MEDRYVLTIQKKKYSFNYFYDNEKEARKAFHNSVSDYGLENAKDEIKPYIFKHNAELNLPYKDKDFDLVISLGTLHNLRISELKIALSEMERVGKKSYLMLESYRNESELFNMQCWALTAESFFDKKEWIWLYDHFGYTGDFEFIYFS